MIFQFVFMECKHFYSVQQIIIHSKSTETNRSTHHTWALNRRVAQLCCLDSANTCPFVKTHTFKITRGPTKFGCIFQSTTFTHLAPKCEVYTYWHVARLSQRHFIRNTFITCIQLEHMIYFEEGNISISNCSVTINQSLLD